MGLTWTEENLNGTIEAMDFFDRARGWFIESDDPEYPAGCPYNLKQTLDAGQTWATSCLPVTDRRPTAMSFGSATHGWLAAGAALWRTTDTGTTWTPQHTFPADPSWLQAEDAARGWVQHGTNLWRTTDGGANWQLLTGAAPATVFFRTSLEGWGTDGSGILKTTDSGKTWLRVFSLPAARTSEWFWDALTGWRAVGSNMERTTDGGATWRSAATGLQAIDTFQFVDARIGWGWHNKSLGLAHTTDGGATWQGQNTSSAALTDLQFVDAWHGWVRNGEQVRGTINGGQSWHDLTSPPLPPLPPPPNDNILRGVNQILFLDATRGWAALFSEDLTPPVYSASRWLSRTTDGGNSWGPLEPAPVDHVVFPAQEHGFGWYSYDNGLYLSWALSRSDDGGRTWTALQWGTTCSWCAGLSDVYAADMERVWSRGTMPFGYSSDGGLTWTDQRAETAGYGTDNWFDRTGRAFSGTGGGLLWYRSTEMTTYRATRPPQIDGNLTDWAGVPVSLLNAERAYRVQWAAPTPLDASATLQAAWDAGNLYFAVRVYDDAIKVDSGAKPWQDDVIEIGLDGRHDHMRNYALGDDRQFTVTALGKIYESGSLLTDVPVARTDTANGYILEFAIPKAKLGGVGLTAKTLSGLNWALIDDDDGGNADSKLEWTGTETGAANASWGQVRLSELLAEFAPVGPTKTVTALQTVGRPTVDGNLTEWQALSQARLDKDTASFIEGAVPSQADLSAGLRTAWAPDRLYFAANISDDVLVGNDSSQIWGDDVLELGVRVGNVTHQFTLALDGRTADNGNPISSLTYVTRTVPGGWTLEVAIPATALGLSALAANQTYPFTFGLWDDDLRTYPGQTHMLWQGTSTNTYQPAWGTLSLSSTIYDFPASRDSDTYSYAHRNCVGDPNCFTNVDANLEGHTYSNVDQHSG